VSFEYITLRQNNVISFDTTNGDFRLVEFDLFWFTTLFSDD
jgi:hypothetical protein